VACWNIDPTLRLAFTPDFIDATFLGKSKELPFSSKIAKTFTPQSPKMKSQVALCTVLHIREPRGTERLLLAKCPPPWKRGKSGQISQKKRPTVWDGGQRAISRKQRVNLGTEEVLGGQILTLPGDWWTGLQSCSPALPPG